MNFWCASACGLGVVIAQANSSKAFTIGVPALALCALLAARGERPWLRCVLRAGIRFLPGILAGCALVALAFGASGMLGEYCRQLRHFANFSSSPPYRLSALPLLTFSIERAPVHAGFVLLGVLAALWRALQREPLNEASVPLAACLLSGGSLLVNPTPFPYNLTWLTPAWLLMAAFGLSQSVRIVTRIGQGALPLALAAGLLSLWFFWRCEQDPYYRRPWDGQLRVVAAAEALTGPADPVLDLCGLVLTRPPVAKDWNFHSLYMPAYHAGQRESVRRIIERVWPPVAISVYRWSFLERADWLAFRRNYLRFSQDVWLLGRVLGPGSGTVQIPRGGRYQVLGVGDASTLDGHPLREGDVLELVQGDHAFVTHQGYILRWNGPGAPEPPPPAANPLFEPGELPKQRD